MEILDYDESVGEFEGKEATEKLMAAIIKVMKTEDIAEVLSETLDIEDAECLVELLEEHISDN